MEGCAGIIGQRNADSLYMPKNKKIIHLKISVSINYLNSSVKSTIKSLKMNSEVELTEWTTKAILDKYTTEFKDKWQ